MSDNFEYNQKARDAAALIASLFMLMTLAVPFVAAGVFVRLHKRKEK